MRLPGKQEWQIVAKLSNIASRQEMLLQFLSPKEHEIFIGFPSAKRSIEFLAGRVVAKLCLSRLTSIDWRVMEIARDQIGRPLLEIEGHPFSKAAIAISHGGAYVYCGAAIGKKIGLDVEPIAEKLLELRESYASSEEWHYIASIGHTKERHTFDLTRLWSAKESLAKYLDVSLYDVIEYARLKSLDCNHLILEYEKLETKLEIRCETASHRGHIFSYLTK